MTVTFAAGLKGKTGATHGPGARIVEGEIKGTSGLHGAKIVPKDLELRTIYNLTVTSASTGTFYISQVATFTAGGYEANYASVAAYGVGLGSSGPLLAALLGTYRVFAIGE
ncbi:MAG: hypothetical protein KAT65_00900 [Methanophagales archaeon]|nr:hypothetical protein [Methanophagales archaeon]